MDWSIVFGGAVLGSLVGACGAATNAYFQRRFERRKWHAEFFIRPRLDALRALHGALVGCQMHYLGIPEKPGAIRMWKNDRERQEVYAGFKALLDELTKAMLVSAVYLEQADLAVVYEFRQGFYQIILGHFEPESAVLDVSSQSPTAESYRKIETRLKELLYPSAVVSALMNEESG